MKSSCGCGIVVGILLGGAVCAGVWYFFYCRNNPDQAEQQFEQVDEAWGNIKDNGDKTLEFVKENFTGRKADPASGKSIPANSAPLPGNPNEKQYSTEKVEIKS